MYYFLSILLDAAAGVLAALPFFIVLELLAARQIAQIPLKHTALEALLCFYAAAVFSITGVPAIYEMHPALSLNLLPFADITTNTAQYLQNILLFVPLGVFLPLLYQRFGKLSSTLLAGFLFSALIEFWQIFSWRATDVDDLLMNTLGAAVGYGIFFLLIWLFPAIRETFLLPENILQTLPARFRYEPCFLFGTAALGALFLRPVLSNALWFLFQ